MDPWLSSSSSSSSEPGLLQQQSNHLTAAATAASDTDTADCANNNNNSQFEDHFVNFTDIIPTSAVETTSTDVPAPALNTASQIPSPSQNNEVKQNGQFEKLPDSDDYLASLEKKLATIRAQSEKSSKESRRQILDSLEQSRTSCMINFLSAGAEGNTTTSEPWYESEVKVNPILKKILPEQAINTEELIQLLLAEQLNPDCEESAEVDKPKPPEQEQEPESESSEKSQNESSKPENNVDPASASAQEPEQK